MKSLRPLFDHQVAAIDGIRSAIACGSRRPMLALPTGAGKTVLAAHIVAGARSKSKRLAFCVPSLGLIDQTFDRFRENGFDPADMGIVQADHPWRRPAAPIQICTAQTLARRELPETDIAVVDEAHIRFGVYDRWMAEKPEVLFIGLSATPWARGLGKQYDRLIRPTSLASLIEAGRLSPFRVFAPSKPDLTGVRTVAGDFHEGDIAERMDRPELVADIVQTWLTKGRGKPTLCFCVNRKHAQSIRDEFAKVGIAVAYVDANTPRAERDDIGKQLAVGEIEVVCNIGCLTTGIDWDVRCLILARPTKSPMLFVQIVGRALRTAEGKAEALILDHSDTHQRLGFVTDVEAAHDELDDGAARKGAGSSDREKKTPLPKCCPACTALVPIHSHVCAACGYQLPVISGVRTVDGELVELSGKTKVRVARSPSVKDMLRDMGKSEVFGQLKWVAIDRRRNPGWAAHAYREIFDDWPRGKVEGAPVAPPDPLLQSYLQHRNIAWAKSKGARHAR